MTTMRHCLIAGIVLAFAVAGYLWYQAGPPAPDDRQEAQPVPTSTHSSSLAETIPPPGLPIVPWGLRDCFPVIRQPHYVNAEQGDSLLASSEPVLGLIVHGQARAYSTNQLNRHEMVLDEIDGVPLVVTY